MLKPTVELGAMLGTWMRAEAELRKTEAFVANRRLADDDRGKRLLAGAQKIYDDATELLAQTIRAVVR